MKLDKTKPYGDVTGSFGGARYKQGGEYFGPTGEHLPKLSSGKAPIPTPPTAPEAPEVVSDEPEESDLSSLHHMKLRQLVKDHGGVYTDRQSAIDFLESKGVA